ncbi:site-specific DNA recombinase [Kitasatospora sp. MAA4]|uniref:recombinase family protein n=1 Tax=Kitasatospora sp. MAA4 TaxID=3035093 RepID=UPI002475AAD6|nr:recombinase family protein [Kitasatospora sp. MAA4]MDH6133950.1 site-specific DNA recombinase [Kitasatospora sp. MAA4]
MERMLTTEYDGCGKCLVGVRRLSRESDASSSRETQMNDVLSAIASVGGHVIGWADDWEVSGATDPLTRPQLGPWLRDEMGPYSGIAGSAVDRIGRNQRDVLNTGYMIKDSGRLLVTYGHDGPWDLDDPTDEMRFSMEAFGAQVELRSIQRRNRKETVRARSAGEPKQKNSYGYRFVRLVPTAKVDHVEIDPVAAEIIRNVAERILADETGMITVSTEAVRLTREGVLSPADHRAVMYGRSPKGGRWGNRALRDLLLSEAALGYLMHQGRPVLGADGHPVRLADPLWDRATRDALLIKLAPKVPGFRAPKGTHLLSGLAFCGTCGRRLYASVASSGPAFICNGRVLGIPSSAHCKPAPSMTAESLDAVVRDHFLSEYGAVPLFRREYDPGSGHEARITELEADRKRLRDDRSAGLYDSADDSQWFRREYARMTKELAEFKQTPVRPAGMRWVLTGETVGDQWEKAASDVARRELLASYNIRVVLFPRTATPRVWVHGLPPEAEAAARMAAWEADQAEAVVRAFAEEARDDSWGDDADDEPWPADEIDA